MTQYVINIGTLPNDGTGDPLRTAFNEVNLNFDQVFAAGPVLSNVQIANNTILTTNTNGNLVLAPNGIGVVQANVNIVPNTSNIRNLGSADRRWSTLYIQYANISGAITVADLTATGNVTVGGNLSVTGNIINVANIITDAKTIQLANTTGTANAADGSGITVGANDAIATMLYSSADNAWNFNIGLQTPNIVVNNISSDDSTFVTIQDGLDVQGDITAETISVTGNITANYFIGNGSQLTGVSNYANANAVAYGQAGWAGNIVPAASNTYSLGNSTLWWSNVWVAGNTIYIGGVPLGMSAGNVLTVNGNAVLQNNSNSTISTTGNITAGYFFGNGSQLTGINVSTSSISNGTSNVNIATANGPVTVSYAGSGNTWTFGNVDVPEALYWPDGSFQATAFVGIAQDLSNPGNATITSNSTGNTTYAWTFDDAGNLTLPTNGSIIVDGGDGAIGPVSDDLVISWDNEEIRMVSVQGSIEMQADAAFRVQTNYDGANVLYASRWEFSNNELVNISNNFGIVSEAGNLTLSGGRDGVNSGNTIITAVDLGNAVYNWTFDNLGNLTLPSGGILYSQGSTPSGAPGNTIILQPSGSGTITNQKLMLYPTAGDGDHLHMVTGNLYETELFLGSDNFYVKLANTGNVVVNTNDDNGNIAQWTFDTTGNLTTPQGMVISGNVNFLGTDTALLNPADNTPLSLFSSGANGTITSFWTDDVGNLMTSNIAAFYLPLQGTQTVRIVNGNNGGNVAIYDFDNTGMFTTGAVCATGNVTSGNVSATGNVRTTNITLTGTGTAVNASSGNILTNQVTGTQLNFLSGLYTVSLNASGASANYTINLPANAGSNGQVLTTDGNGALSWTTAASSYGNANVATFLASYGSNTISTTGNITAGNLIGNINLTGNVTGTSANVTLVAGSYSWVFDNTGNLVLPGNTFAVNYANGTQVSLGGGTYGDSNVVTLLGTFGSNTISTTGTVTAGNITGANLLTGGSISATGNVTANNIGNIAAINLNGNSSQVLYGNGVFAAVAGGSTYGDSNVATFLASYGANTISSTGNITSGNVSTSGTLSVTGNATIDGTGSNLTRRASFIGAANTAVTLDNFEARLGGSPVRLYINTVSGNATLTGTSQTYYSGGVNASQWVNVPVGAGAANAFAMSGAVSPSTGGEMVMLNFCDQISGTFMYRVTAIVANTTSGNNAVTIERLA